MESAMSPSMRLILSLSIVCSVTLSAGAYARDLEKTYRQMLTERRPTPELRAFLSQHTEFISTTSDQSETALHIAAERGDTSFAEFLISNEANINATYLDKRNLTPLAYAIRSCKLDVVKLLLKRGAEPDRLLFFAWENSCNPTEELSHLRSSDINKFLQSISEQRNKISPMIFIDLLIKYGANPNESDAMGNTLLHILVEQGNVKDVQFLISRNARVDVQNKNGATPRDVALIMVGVVSLMYEDFLSEFEKMVADNESKRVAYPTMIRKFRDFLADFNPRKKSFTVDFDMPMLMSKHGITGMELLEYGKYRAEYAEKKKLAAHSEIENRLQVYKALVVSNIEDEDSSNIIFVVFVIIILTGIISTGIVFLMRRFS